MTEAGTGKRQWRCKLSTRQARLLGGLRAPATGGATLQARLSGALGHWRPVELSKTEPKDQENLQVERNEELQGPQGSGEEIAYTVRLLAMNVGRPMALRVSTWDGDRQFEVND